MPPKTTKSHVLQVLVEPRERDEIKDAAADAELKISTWARRVLLREARAAKRNGGPRW